MSQCVHVRCPRSVTIKLTLADGSVKRVVALSMGEAERIKAVARRTMGSYLTSVETFAPRITGNKGRGHRANHR